MTNLYDIVLKQIKASNHIGFYLGKDNTWIGHTSVVIEFDRIALFTIDFGANDGQSGTIGSLATTVAKSAMACSILAPGSSVHVNEFEFSRTQKGRVLLEFAITTDLGKTRAVNLLVALSRIEMGNYHVLNNNCRDFVAKAMDVLVRNKKIYDHASNSHDDNSKLQNASNLQCEEMQAIKDEDREKIVAAGVGAGAALLGIGLLGYQIFKAFTWNDSDEKQRHNRK